MSGPYQVTTQADVHEDAIDNEKREGDFTQHGYNSFEIFQKDTDYITHSFICLPIQDIVRYAVRPFG